jgi:LysR family transcriptional activator of nhaA
MEWLNYHHLLYFWVVAKAGSLARASRELHLAHPTLSGQIHRLEEALGTKLFTRQGRNLVLTEAGHVAFRYADEIFSLGREFLDTVKGRASGRPLRLVVGVSNVLPKSMVYRMLEPIFHLTEPVRVLCREDRSTEAFLGELAMHAVDVVLADAPVGPGTAVRAFNHLLGVSGTTFFAAPQLAESCGQGFPHSLDGMPFLLPAGSAMLRRTLEQWFAAQDIRPQVVGELEDAALVKVLGEAGLGIFAAPSVDEEEVLQRYQVQRVGCVEALQQRFYAISAERRIRHPAVIAICEAARRDIFV